MPLELEFSIILRFSVCHTRDMTHNHRVVVVMITDPVVVNTSSTNHFFFHTSTKFLCVRL